MATGRERQAIHRLRRQLRDPSLYIERRIDEVRDISSRCVDWCVRMQVHLPEAPGDSNQPAENYVSLGIFWKKRLPDLVAVDGAGTQLPLLRRSDRARALVGLLMHDLVQSIDPQDDAGAELSKLAWDVVTKNPEAALVAYQEYEVRAQRLGETYTSLELHLQFVRHFVDFTHVLALVREVPGSTCMVTYTFSERYTFPERPGWSSDAGVAARWIATRMGLLPVPIKLKLSGANHAHSYYLLVQPPPGTETETLFWRSVSTQPGADDAAGYVHESRHDSLACYDPAHNVDGGRATIELRLNGRSLRPLWLVNLAIVALATYLGHNTAGPLSSNISVLAAIPAGLVAIITQRQHELTARIGNWIQRAYLFEACLTALVGVALLGNLLDAKSGGLVDDVISDDGLTTFLAGYSAFTLGILTHICFRPRPITETANDPSTLSAADVSAYRVNRRRSAIAGVMGAAAFAVGAVLLTV